MIKGKATILFGTGSVESQGFVDADSGIGHIYMNSAVPGKVGRHGSVRQSLTTEAEVVVYFTNVESLNSQIDLLTALRDDMIKVEHGG